jgi:hypothetical protein
MDKIVEAVQSALADGLSPSYSYDSPLAAIALGVCTKTLHRLRVRGIVPAFAVPSQVPGKVVWRYRVEDLDEFILKHRSHKRYWHPDEDSELPAHVAARLLGITPESLYVLKSRGKLTDYQPETIRTYLQKTHSRKVAAKAKRDARARESSLRLEIRRLQDRLGDSRIRP